MQSLLAVPLFLIRAKRSAKQKSSMVIKRPESEVEAEIKKAIPGSGQIEDSSDLCLPL